VGASTTISSGGSVHVLATTFEATRAALSAAIPLAKGSASRLIVIVPKVISYAVPLDDGMDSTEFAVRHYRDLVADFDGSAQVRICLCRRVDDIVRQLLPSGSTVVVAGHAKRWLASEEMKLARRLTALGHHVVFVPLPQHSAAAMFSADTSPSD